MSTRRHEDANPVGFLRYCLDEAWTAIRRRWRVAMLSTALIAAAVFVVGAALGASEALRDVTTRMTEAAELSVYLAREATAADRERAARITREDAAVAAAEVLDEAQATARVTSDFPDLAAVITALPERPLGEVSVFDLINAFNGILKRLNQKEDLREIFEENFTVSDKIELVLKLLSSGVPMLFTELFAGVASRAEIVVTFLAVLELIRVKQVSAVQEVAFGEIMLRRV